MRLFVAVRLPSAERARIGAAVDAAREGLPRARWVPTEQLHLTLSFLGEVDDRRRDEIAGAVAEGTSGRAGFAATVGRPGAFPSLERPRVLWLAVAPEPEWGALATAVGGALAAIGFAPEERPFRPHLTVARIKDRWPRESGTEWARRLEATAAVSTPWPVDAVDLVRSHLSSAGARHEVVTSFALECAA